MRLVELSPNEHIELEVRVDGTRRVHVFDDDMILAVNTAWAAERPLLVRGEPGVGKSQLAEAVANHTDRKFLPFVVDSKTEARDLLWRFDAVKRLGDAQMLGVIGRELCSDDTPSAERLHTIRTGVDQELSENKYIKPGPLWWAFDWQSALDQNNVSQANSPYPGSRGDQANGCVVLIDEIDKAETDVPNGLLGALGAKEFQPFGIAQPICVNDMRPLVIITTNEERSLPDAFVRRCIVHFIDVPDTTEDDLIQYLVGRGQQHFPKVDLEVLREAAHQLHQDRAEAKRQQFKPYPGQAEYLDLIRAVCCQEEEVDKQRDLLRRISKFALKKNRGATA